MPDRERVGHAGDLSTEHVRACGSGKNAYLMPGPDSNGLNFLAWLNGNPSTIWNYYDVGIALYRLYYRTGNNVFQTQARQFADIHWQWMLDHGYNFPYPRAASMVSQFFRALDGHSERLPGLYVEISNLVRLFADPSGSPNIDNREAGYTFGTWPLAPRPKATQRGTLSTVHGSHLRYQLERRAIGGWKLGRERVLSKSHLCLRSQVLYRAIRL